MKLVIITGVSGAGKSQVIKYLEDVGYFCVDNLPAALLPKFVDVIIGSYGKFEKIALVIDVRGGVLLKDFIPSLNFLDKSGINYEILFLDASDEVLIKRYKESRRLHPLSRGGRILKGLIEERKMLTEIKKRASYIIETSNLTNTKLKEEIAKLLLQGENFEGLIINLISFGFKYGIPTDCDVVLDVRFIPNPFYIDSMKFLNGKDSEVKKYVFGFDVTNDFVTKLTDMMEFLIPNYIKEGKRQLVIGIGCTGGKHRSVAISDEFYSILENNKHSVVIEHRDIEKDDRGK